KMKDIKSTLARKGKAPEEEIKQSEQPVPREFQIVGKMKDRLTRYLEVRLRLLLLHTIAITSRVLGQFILELLLLLIAYLLLLLMGMGAAEGFSAWTGSRTAGYFLAVALYLLLGMVVVLLRRPILKRLSDMFIRAFTSDDGDDEQGPE